MVEQKYIVRNEETLEDKKVLSKVNIKGEKIFVSGVFTRSKNDDLKRITLNLKRFNKIMGYKTFKTEYLQILFDLIRSTTYIVFINQKDAIYLVSVHENQ